MSTPPPADVITPTDHTPFEIESRAEFDRHYQAGSLAGLTVQGLRLDLDPPDLGPIDLTGTLFVGCRFASVRVAAELVARGAVLVPEFADLPYPTAPPALYLPGDLAAGFPMAGFAGMSDTVVYQHFRAAGGATPGIREALAQRLHDSAIDNALADLTGEWTTRHGPAAMVGVMGGHAEPRGSAAYRQAATLGAELARAGRVVVTGGGPGMMEAANLGGYLAGRHPDELAAAIDLLAGAPDFTDHDAYTAAALAVRERWPADPALPWPARGGLSIPTWLYGHEPANLFAARIAKYFSNAIREDTVLRLCRGGIVFAPGRAGTVQEIFQAATKTFYASDGASGPYVFLGRAYWAALPAPELLATLLGAAPGGGAAGLIRVTDEVAEAVRLLTG